MEPTSPSPQPADADKRVSRANWLAHDANLGKGGAEPTDTGLSVTAEQEEAARQEMQLELFRRTPEYTALMAYDGRLRAIQEYLGYRYKSYAHQGINPATFEEEQRQAETEARDYAAQLGVDIPSSRQDVDRGSDAFDQVVMLRQQLVGDITRLASREDLRTGATVTVHRTNGMVQRDWSITGVGYGGGIELADATGHAAKTVPVATLIEWNSSSSEPVAAETTSER